MNGVLPRSHEIVSAEVVQAALDCSYVHVRRYGRAIPALIEADFSGVRVPDRFVFGFGMDVGGAWRNLPSIRALAETAD